MGPRYTCGKQTYEQAKDSYTQNKNKCKIITLFYHVKHKGERKRENKEKKEQQEDEKKKQKRSNGGKD